MVASKSYERGYKLLSQFFRSFVETVHEKDRPLLGEGGPNDIQGHFQLRRKPFRAQLGVLDLSYGDHERQGAVRPTQPVLADSAAARKVRHQCRFSATW